MSVTAHPEVALIAVKNKPFHWDAADDLTHLRALF